jgi:hypothetical protein
LEEHEEVEEGLAISATRRVEPHFHSFPTALSTGVSSPLLNRLRSRKHLASRSNNLNLTRGKFRPFISPRAHGLLGDFETTSACVSHGHAPASSIHGFVCIKAVFANCHLKLPMYKVIYRSPPTPRNANPNPLHHHITS